MFSTPESKAWAVLVTGFCLFCALAVGIPLLVRSYVIRATTVEASVLDPVEGIVYVKSPGDKDYVMVTQRSNEIPEGASIATGEDRTSFLRLFDDSTLTLYNDTEIVLERVRAPRYDASPRPNNIQLRVVRGRVGIAVASPIKGTSQIDVRSPHARLELQEGSYSVDVVEDETQLTIRTIRPGEATVIGDQDKRTVNWGRCRIVEGQPIEGPLDPQQNLIVNSDFSSPLGRGWEEQPVQRDERDPEGVTEIVVQDGKTLLHFERGGALTHGETSIIQDIGKDVRDFASLRLSFEVLVNWQSLPGGGYLSTEFPVMVELGYKDNAGNALSRYWGFYFLDPGEGPEYVKMINGTKVIQGEWYPFESDNLMLSLRDNRPVYIDFVRVYASGWDWDSAITDISLWVQE